MKNDELAKKIVNLETEINDFKTSQQLGSGSGVLIPVATINETFSNLSHRFPSIVLVFTSENTLRPIITPYVTGALSGSEYDNTRVSYDMQSLTMGTPSSYSVTDPKQTMCNIFAESEYGVSGTFNFTGIVYANCRGKLEIFRYV